MWITENVRAARLRGLPDLELPLRFPPGTRQEPVRLLSDRDPQTAEVTARTGHRTGRRAPTLSTSRLFDDADDAVAGS